MWLIEDNLHSKDGQTRQTYWKSNKIINTKRAFSPNSQPS